MKLNHVATDGTKIKANASKHSAMSFGYMEKEEKRLRKEAEQILNDMEKTDRAEDKKYGNRRGDELPEELATREKRQAAIKKAMAELEERVQEKAGAAQIKARKKLRKKVRNIAQKRYP